MQLPEISAIVTGGASGLGAATAEHLRKNGAAVAILDRDPRGADFAEIIGAAFFETDVTSESSTLAAIRGAKEALGRINACINCAGIVTAAKTFGRSGAHDLAVFRRTIDVNLTGTFNVLRLAVEEMVANKPNQTTGERGVIINTASVAAYDGQKGQVGYAASKAAVAGMTLPLARDLADHNIRVCAIAPGVIGTPMMRGLSEQVQSGLTADVPFPQRMGEPEEFARLVGFLLESAYINGEVVRLDGGLRMR